MNVQRNQDSEVEELNRLYWEGDMTVGAIGEQLGMSKTALYAAIEPTPSGAKCAECGELTVFTNRTNRAAGIAFCASCNDSVGLVQESAAGQRKSESSEDSLTDANGWERWREDLRSVPPQRVAMIGGAAVVGVILGAVAVRAVREMR